MEDSFLTGSWGLEEMNIHRIGQKTVQVKSVLKNFIYIIEK
jgi:hypothetical protein